MELKQNSRFAQKERYAERAKNFLLIGGTSTVAAFGAFIAAPSIGALAIPAMSIAATASVISMAGMVGSTIAKNITDVDETKSVSERMMNSLREKFINSSNSIKPQ